MMKTGQIRNEIISANANLKMRLNAIKIIYNTYTVVFADIMLVYCIRMQLIAHRIECSSLNIYSRPK